jgi:hypothetical protein
MLDLQWPYKRHSEIFAGVERYAEERGWVSIIDEFVHDTLRRRGGVGALQNYFRKAIQRPIAAEIRRVRIERAKRELAQSDRTLDAIARDVKQKSRSIPVGVGYHPSTKKGRRFGRG